MTSTRSRTIQYIGILISLFLIAVGYWYWQAKAGTKLQQSTDVPMSTNLVGYWSFDGDDISGTTAYDRSGSGNNGTLTNGPTKTNGKLGQALSFVPPSDQYSNMGSPAVLDNLSSFSVSQWIYPRSTGYNQQGLITSKSWGSSGWTIQHQTYYNIFINVRYSTTNLQKRTVSGSISPNQWQHVVVTWDGSTSAANVHIYINGVEATYDSSTNASGTRGDDSSGNLYIGAVPGAFITYDGHIDESRVYNTVLTASQVYDLYKLGGETVGASTPTRDSLNEGLAGYWKLDDASGTTATDSSTNGNNGTLTNGPTWGTGQIGGAAVFDGTDDYVTIPHNSVLNAYPITVSAWFKTADANGGRIVGKYYSASGSGYQIYFTGSSLCTWYFKDGSNNVYGGGDGLCASGSYNDNMWHLATFVVNSSGGNLYVDGISKATLAWSGTPGATTTAENLTSSFYSGSSAYLSGLVDEVRVYNRALSAEEITRLYKTTTPSNPDTRLKGYWSFDGDSIAGTMALDLSGSGNNGTLTNSPAKDIGVRGQALSFDGTDDRASLGTPAFLQTDAEGTVTAWVKGSGYYLAKTDNGVPGGDWQYSLRFSIASSKVCLSSQPTTTELLSVCTTNSIDTAVWNFVATKVTTAGGSEIYVNGVKQTLTYTTGSQATHLWFSDAWKSGTNALYVGVRNPNGSPAGYFSGSIDEVRIYNAALSASEIYNLYQEGSVKVNKAQNNNGDSLNDGLAGYWKLDDASGTTATDSSGNSGNGTLTNGPTWGTGQIGGATTFDGTNDYITVPDAAILRPGNGDFTVSVWANPPNTNQLAFLVSKTAGNPGYSMRICGADPSCGGYSGKRFVFTYAESMVAPIYRGAYSTADIADGSWHLFTAVADKTANLIRLYVDGKEIAANQGTGGSWPNITNTEALILGSFTGSNYYHTGSLDEVRVYNRALSADEVSRLYKTTSPTNPETGLVGYWSFNGSDMSGTTAYDRSGRGNNGTLTNGPTLTIGKVGQGLSFDNNNDWIAVQNGSSYRFPNTTFSVAAWFKRTSATGGNTMVANGACSGGWRFYSASEIGLTLYQAGACGPYAAYRLSSTSGLSDGQWHFAVAVVTTDTSVTGNNTVSLYLDGALNQSTLNQNGTYASPANTYLEIGSYDNGFGSFNGSLDEVRVYNRALSASEIANLYNFGR